MSSSKADMRSAVPALRRFRAVAKAMRSGLRSRYARTFHSFGPTELASRLRSLGLEHGDVILVHSSFDAFIAFDGRPTDVIRVLQQSVGRDGVVLMPTMPFTNTAVAWVRDHPCVDMRRTPSRMGLISEVFRRAPGVFRSTHPTHPVAGWGRDVIGMLADHHLALTPCGKSSPYHNLLERGGKIVLLGADFASLTIFHTAEELFESRLPVSPFTVEVFVLEGIATDGTKHTITTRLFEPSVSRRRNLSPLLRELTERGAVRKTKAGLLAIVVITARDVIDAVGTLAGRGIYCYDDYPESCARQRA